MTRYIHIALYASGLVLLGSCMSDENSPGLEYMPDMYRSPAIEAYVDYGQDPYHFTEEKAQAQRNTPSARKPVPGTIAYTGEMGMTYGMPYQYPNTPEGYEAAGVALTSPMPTTQLNIETGQEVYTKMCSHCHGVEGKGDGAISKNGFILGIPDYSGKLKDLSVGKMYHTLQYGKGLMGSHASQLSQKERWQVIQYVLVLQNGGTMPEFDADGNVMTGAQAPEASTESENS
jgi:mono/diheme cytochrome c family protein